MNVPAWKRYGYESYESWIESKAGACPPPYWPMPKPPPYPADDENLTTEEEPSEHP